LSYVRINIAKIPKKVLNMKVGGKYPKGRQEQDWEKNRKDVTEKEGRT
jgi:hypothetical protein